MVCQRKNPKKKITCQRVIGLRPLIYNVVTNKCYTRGALFAGTRLAIQGRHMAKHSLKKRMNRRCFLKLLFSSNSLQFVVQLREGTPSSCHFAPLATFQDHDRRCLAVWRMMSHIFIKIHYFKSLFSQWPCNECLGAHIFLFFERVQSR